MINNNDLNQSAEETKRCPFCGEKILKIAKKCKHCMEFLKNDKLENKQNNRDSEASQHETNEAQAVETPSTKEKENKSKAGLIALIVIFVIVAAYFYISWMPEVMKDGNEEIRSAINNNPRFKLLGKSCSSVKLSSSLLLFIYHGYATLDDGKQLQVKYTVNPFTMTSSFEISQSEMADLAASEIYDTRND